jgi:hypothetical protein
MRVVSHPEADQELEAAALWYEDRQPGLGEDFLDEFDSSSTVSRLISHGILDFPKEFADRFWRESKCVGNKSR